MVVNWYNRLVENLQIPPVFLKTGLNGKNQREIRNEWKFVTKDIQNVIERFIIRLSGLQILDL